MLKVIDVLFNDDEDECCELARQLPTELNEMLGILDVKYNDHTHEPKRYPMNQMSYMSRLNIRANRK